MFLSKQWFFLVVVFHSGADSMIQTQTKIIRWVLLPYACCGQGDCCAERLLLTIHLIYSIQLHYLTCYFVIFYLSLAVFVLRVQHLCLPQKTVPSSVVFPRHLQFFPSLNFLGRFYFHSWGRCLLLSLYLMSSCGAPLEPVTVLKGNTDKCDSFSYLTFFVSELLVTYEYSKMRWPSVIPAVKREGCCILE